MEPENLEWVEGRIVVYDLLRHLYLRPPTPEVLSLVRSLRLNLEAAPAAIRKGLDLLQGSSGDETVVPALVTEYTRLFVGPGQVPVPPFESCYRTGDSLVMQEVTTQVRRAYLEAGLLARRLYSDPDDHVGMEWEFLYALATKAAGALARGDATEARTWLAQRRAFLQDHLLRWSPQFCERLLAATPHTFFQGLALFTQGLLEIEAQELAEGM